MNGRLELIIGKRLHNNRLLLPNIIFIDFSYIVFELFELGDVVDRLDGLGKVVVVILLNPSLLNLL